jgi:hypothetical protein
VYRRFPLFLYIQGASLIMLCAIVALIAAGCFVFMVVAILISLQLSDNLQRAERELERQKRISVEDRPTLWRVK